MIDGVRVPDRELVGEGVGVVEREASGVIDGEPEGLAEPDREIDGDAVKLAETVTEADGDGDEEGDVDRVIEGEADDERVREGDRVMGGETEADADGPTKEKRARGVNEKPLWSYGDVLVPRKGNLRSLDESPLLSEVSMRMTTPILDSAAKGPLSVARNNPDPKYAAVTRMPLLVMIRSVPTVTAAPKFPKVPISNLTVVRGGDAIADISSRTVDEKVTAESDELIQLVLFTRKRRFFPSADRRYWMSTASGAPPLRVTSIFEICRLVVAVTIDGIPTK